MTYPVYDCARADYTRDTTPIGHAANEAEALALLAKHFDGTGAESPAKVELNDRETNDGPGKPVFIWAYWPVYA